MMAIGEGANLVAQAVDDAGAGPKADGDTAHGGRQHILSQAVLFIRL